MTDLEITMACAQAMELVLFGDGPYIEGQWDDCGNKIYDPLHDDTQMVALVKKFRLQIHHHKPPHLTVEFNDAGKISVHSAGTDLNRTVCECVAKLQKATEHV